MVEVIVGLTDVNKGAHEFHSVLLMRVHSHCTINLSVACVF